MEDIIRASFTEFYKALAQTNQTLIKATTAVEDRRQSILGLLENSFQMPEPPLEKGCTSRFAVNLLLLWVYR